MSKKSKKKPIFGVQPLELGKKPRFRDPTPGRPVWRVGRLDWGGEWCPSKIGETVITLLDRLKSFESMAWIEIEQGGSHPIPLSRIIPEAQKRLQELKLDDVDDLYSLRISGKERFWGIRQGDAFLALWWDPEHKICHVEKKHT